MIEAVISAQRLGSTARADTVPCVFIVDDDISVRESLELLIEAAGWRALVFACAAEFLACPRVSVPSCLVLDVALPDVNGLDLQDRVAPDRVATPIVFITGSVDIPMTVRAMKAGAVEFLTKPLRDDALLAAIERALEVSGAKLRREAEMMALRSRHASLTCREAEVMSLVVAGRLNKQVAAELDISEITVKAHRGKLMRKMSARTLPDLVRMAARLGIAA
jgi:FixJ family two-component response regulator